MFAPRRNHSYQIFLFYVIVSFLFVVTLNPAVKAQSDTKTNAQRVDRAQSDVGYDSGELERSEEFQTVRQTLQRQDVRDRLRQLGYSKQEIQERLERFSPAEVQRMAERIQYLKAGGAAEDKVIDLRWVIVSRTMLLVIFSPFAVFTVPLLIVYYFLYAIGPKKKSE